MRSAICLAVLLIVTVPAVAKECRRPDVPPGVRIAPPPGCQTPVHAGGSEAARQDRARGDAGIVDLGDGTRVMIGGRVQTEIGVRR